MAKTRVAIFGLNQGGRFGRRAIKNPDCDLVAVAGFDAKAEETAAELGAPLYAHYQDVLDNVEIDAAVIALPNELHLPATKAAVAAGVKYILVEKPIAPVPEEAQEIIDVCRENGATLLVGHQRRSSSLILFAKEFIASGRLGDIVSLHSTYALEKNPGYWDDEWHQRPTGGPLLVNAIHDIDDINNIMNMTPTKVYAAKRSTIRGHEAEDSCSALIEFAEGPTATYFVSDGTPSPYCFDLLARSDERFAQESGVNELTVFGTKGSFGFPNMDFYHYEDEEHEGWFYPLVHEHFDVEYNHPLQAEVDHFIDLCQGRETVPRCTGEDGLRTLKIVNAIIESGNSGQVVTIS